MAFQTLPRNGFGPKRKFGQGYIPARPDTSSSSGSSSSSTEVKSETTHTSGNTIVADLSGGSFAALSATLTMERMSSAFLEKVGTPGIGVVQIAGIKMTAAQVFTAELTGTPSVGDYILHLTFSDVDPTT